VPTLIRENYTAEYYHNHAEPHRRRATVLHFPCTVWHFGIYYPNEDKRRQFAEAISHSIRTNLKDWRIVQTFSEIVQEEKKYTPLTDTFITSFFEQVWNPRAEDQNHRRKENVFCFEIVPPCYTDHKHVDDNKCVVRFEQHSEYLTVSVFSYFSLLNNSDGSIIVETFKYTESGFRSTPSKPFQRLPEMADWDERLRLVAKNNPMTFLSETGFIASPELAPGSLDNALEQTIADIITAAPGAVFCDFRGIFTPCDIFEPYRDRTERRDNPKLSDVFCPEGQAAFPTGHDFTPAQAFLSRIWPTLAQSPIFKVASENLVGCYMQGGHAIYLSALGAQGLRPSAPRLPHPLTFLVIYKPPEHPARNGNAYRWRLSRLVNRLVEVGVRRTASLRSLEKIRDANASIRQIETDMESRFGGSTTESVVASAANKKDEVSYLATMMQRIEAVYSRFRTGTEIESLSYRISRNRRHYNTMMLLIDDLGVLKIPGWYPYDHFVKRRLSTTHENIVSLQARLQDIEDRIRTRLQFADTFPTEPQREIAIWAFGIGAAAVGGQAFAALGDALPTLFALPSLPWFTSLEPWLQIAKALLILVGICLGVLFGTAIGKRAAKQMFGADQSSKARRRATKRPKSPPPSR
jgi:hypothetical protein